MTTLTLPAPSRPARGITFSGHMVRALLAGKKTVTRRLITAPADLSEFMSAHELAPGEWIFWSSDRAHLADFTRRAYQPGEGVRCPLGAVGDTLYVRETWRVGSWDEGVIAVDYAADGHARAEWLAVTDDQWLRLVHQSVDDVEAAGLTLNAEGRYTWPFGQAPTRWRLPRYMPRVASRISLEIQSVRPERLHDITDVDAINEGVCSLPDEWVAAHWPEYVAERDRVKAINDELVAGSTWASPGPRWGPRHASGSRPCGSTCTARTAGRPTPGCGGSLCWPPLLRRGKRDRAGRALDAIPRGYAIRSQLARSCALECSWKTKDSQTNDCSIQTLPDGDDWR